MINEPMQYEFEFDQDVNVKGELFLQKYLTTPCEWCNKYEADQTINRMRTGETFNICNNCAEDDEMDWAEKMSER